MKKRILSVAIMSVIALGTISAAAKTVGVGGGTWTYGVSSVVYSEYFHEDEEHGSSVKNGNNQKDTDYNRAPGETSDASIAKTDSGNQSYYCTGHRN